jgi:hypothetical protein
MPNVPNGEEEEDLQSTPSKATISREEALIRSVICLDQESFLEQIRQEELANKARTGEDNSEMEFDFGPLPSIPPTPLPPVPSKPAIPTRPSRKPTLPPKPDPSVFNTGQEVKRLRVLANAKNQTLVDEYLKYVCSTPTFSPEEILLLYFLLTR